MFLSEAARDVNGRFLLVQIVTLARVPLAVGLACLLTSRPAEPLTLILPATALLVLIELTDLFDGLLARRLRVVSEWGAMLDPYADSVARLIIYWALGAVGLGLTVLPLVMAIRDVTVAYCRVVWTRNGGSVSARFSGKAKAVAQCAGAFCLLWLPILLGRPELVRSSVSWIVIAATVWSGLDYLKPTLGMVRR